MKLWQNLLILSILWFAFPCSAQTLQGGVSESHALPDTLAPGQAFEDGNIPSAKSAIEWWPVPNWLEGIFQIRDLMTPDTTGKKKYQINAHESYGRLRDARGTAWDAFIVPGSSTYTLNGIRHYQTTTSAHLLAVSESQLVYESTAIDIAVSDQGIIQRARTDTTKKTLYPEKHPGKVGCVQWITSYNHLGEPVEQKRVISTYYRTGEFSADCTNHGIDLRQSFVDFLVRSGHSELIPAGLQTGIPGTPTTSLKSVK